jgi:hypothetical protein
VLGRVLLLIHLIEGASGKMNFCKVHNIIYWYAKQLTVMLLEFKFISSIKLHKQYIADNSVFPYSNANDMHVTQDLNSFGDCRS